ncbi:MAG TPA: efflux transporter outer membrane subunit, partial [Chromatiales bacterium]|nr:efflux transporter outer membrane subunit [Chromatiales bacterium]
MIRRFISIAGLALLMSGCMLGPDYQRPDIPLPDDFGQQIDSGESIVNLPWWELFRDEQLKALIAVALRENKDVAIAAARVEEVRARLGFVRADQFPQIGIGAEGTRTDPGAVNPNFGINDQYKLAADLSFELDVWGRLRRSTEAARAELLATEEARRTVIVSLVANVASAYLLLRDADHRLDISERTLASRVESLRIIQARFDRGTVPLIDVNQAEIQTAEAMVSVATAKREIAQAENLISVLLGRNPGPVLRNHNDQDPSIRLPAVPAGLPAQLLARRPDIRQAEQLLAAQTARIGAAQALRLPTLSLTGAFGLASNELSKFNTGEAVAWNIGANLFGPLFDAGKSKRQVEIEKARTEQLLKQYERTVQQGLREVEDALVSIRTRGEELAARQRQLNAARSAAMLSHSRYDGGVTSYLEVL